MPKGFFGRAPLKQYRTDYTPTKVAPGAEQEKDKAILHYDNFHMCFVEINDKGNLWDKKQLDAVENYISDLGKDNDLIILVFTHGWRHNASPEDTNVISFRETLGEVANVEKSIADVREQKTRIVIGLYIGWRGLTFSGTPMYISSFWARKRIAHRVGDNGAREVFERLKKIVQKPPASQTLPTRLILIGHSLGGAVTFSAVDNFVKDQLAQKDPKPFCDFVVLINPAFEASKYQEIFELSLKSETDQDQKPLLGVFTSIGDGATRFIFPTAQFLPSLKAMFKSGVSPLKSFTTVGHYNKMKTHKLEKLTDEEVSRIKNAPNFVPLEFSDFNNKTELYEKIERFKEVRKTKDPMILDDVALTRCQDPAFNPVLNVEVGKNIISGHNDIFEKDFREFLRDFIVYTTI